MKITPDTTFAQLEGAQRRAHEAAILRATAQTEAARELLERATANGTDPTFWGDALEFAEAHEASARRAFAKWQQRDRMKAHRAHEFSRALLGATYKQLQKAEASVA